MSEIKGFKELEYDELKSVLLETYAYDQQATDQILKKYEYIKDYNINYTDPKILNTVSEEHSGIIEEVGIKAYLAIMDEMEGNIIDTIIKSKEKLNVDESISTFIALKANNFNEELTNYEQNFSSNACNQAVLLNSDNIFKFDSPTYDQMLIGFENVHYIEYYYDELVYFHLPNIDEYTLSNIIRAMSNSKKDELENIINKIDQDYLSQIKINIKNVDEEKINFEVVTRRDNKRLDFKIPVIIDLLELSEKLNVNIKSERDDIPITKLKDLILEHILQDKYVKSEIKRVSKNQKIIYLDKAIDDTVATDIFKHFENNNMVITSIEDFESFKSGEFNLKTREFVTDNITNYYNNLSEDEREDYMFLKFNNKYEEMYINITSNKDKLDYFINSIIKSEDLYFILNKHNEIFNEVKISSIKDEYNNRKIDFISLSEPSINEALKNKVYMQFLYNNEIGYFDKEKLKIKRKEEYDI